jgi:hypothetical protein
MSHQNIASIKDASYQGCISAEKGLVIGKYLLDVCPTFLDSIPAEVKAEIESGQMLRFHENNPPQYYKDGVPCESTTKGAIKVDINVVMSFSQQEFGRFKNEDPVKHGIHKSWRDKWSTYKSNRTKDLIGYVRDYKNSLEGKTRARSATKDFAVWLKEDWLVSLKSRAKTAKARGDVTVDDTVVSAIAKAIK